MTGRLRTWLDDGRGYELIGEWTARVVGAIIAAVFTYFAQQAWGWSESIAIVLSVVAFVFILVVTRDG